MSDYGKIDDHKHFDGDDDVGNARVLSCDYTSLELSLALLKKWSKWIKISRFGKCSVLMNKVLILVIIFVIILVMVTVMVLVLVLVLV